MEGAERHRALSTVWLQTVMGRKPLRDRDLDAKGKEVLVLN